MVMNQTCLSSMLLCLYYHSCCKILTSFPNKLRTYNLRTLHGSLRGTCSMGMLAFLTLTKAASILLTSIDKYRTGVPDPPSEDHVSG
jgi:hypothetical protein